MAPPFWGALEDSVTCVDVCACVIPLVACLNLSYNCATLTHRWPAYWDNIPGAVDRHVDNTMGMRRVEITCANCGGHLGAARASVCRRTSGDDILYHSWCHACQDF